MCGSEGPVSGHFEAPLVIYAKSQAAFDSKGLFDGGLVDPDSGEWIRLGRDFQTVRDPAEVRLERFALQSVARSILPKSRTAKCLRLRQRGRDVEIHRSLSGDRAVYGGLQTCASVWCCPVCAAKIAERRRHELVAAVAAWRAMGGAVYLYTLTHPHTREDALETLLQAETKALIRFWGHRQVRVLWASVGMVGHVRAWEVTNGRRGTQNGWHPHFHILIFCRPLSKPERLQLQASLFPYWSDACAAAGLARPDPKRVRLDDGQRAARYASKWGLEDEMTKAHVKRGRLGGETPFDLLRAAFADPKDRQARLLFAEYAAAYQGKRQLVWSRGLRDLLDLGADVSDQEIAESQEDHLYLLGRITVEQWRLVLRADLRGELLELARSGGWEAVSRCLSSLESHQVRVSTGGA